MEDIPSLSSGSVGSRFVSQTDIDEAKKKRDEQWKAAYARLGQEPPERPQEDVYDGRSLAEKLASNKAAQQEEWEQKMKLSNQFRSLEEDEVIFLDSIRERQLEEERELKERDTVELKNFREAVAARQNEASKPPATTNPSKPAPTTSRTAEPSAMAKRKLSVVKKDKDKLKGVIVKKKSAAVARDNSVLKNGASRGEGSQTKDRSEEREIKRQRTETFEQTVARKE